MTETVEQYMARGGYVEEVKPERINSPFWGKTQFSRKKYHANTGDSPKEREVLYLKPLVKPWNTDPSGVDRFLDSFGK